MKDIHAVLPLLSIVTLFPTPSSMQTSNETSTASSSPISYSTALYILIGVAAFYSIATLVCCVLTVLNCLKGQKPRRDKRDTPYRDIHLTPLRTRLDTITEENECSRTSSQISVSKKLREKETLSFSNRSALEALENEPDSPGTPDLPDEISGTNFGFVNKSALEIERAERSETSESDITDGLAERGAVITTSFKKVVPMRNIGDSKKGGLQPNDSPLLRYSPRGATIPPSEVKVPWEDDTEVKKATKLGIRQSPDHQRAGIQKTCDGTRQSPDHHKPIGFKGSGSPGSPFHKKRKNPKDEIPSSSEKSDLLEYRRKKSSSGLPSHNKVHPGGKLPPLNRKPTTGVVHTSSANPFRSSPSGSPFLTPVAKHPTSNIAAHSTSSTSADPSPSTSTGSSASIPTAETLIRELQSVKRKWYIIGTKLNFPKNRLNIIKIEHRDSTDKCLATLCEEWVESSSKEATWLGIVAALRSSLVDEKDLADTLEREFCFNSNSKTWVR